MLTALDHVILAEDDLDAAEAGYQALLGLSPSWSGDHPTAGTRNVLFRLENTYIEPLSPSGDGHVDSLVRGFLEARGEGLLGLAFATNDIEACRAKLAALGLEPGPVEKGQGRDRATGAERRCTEAAPGHRQGVRRVSEVRKGRRPRTRVFTVRNRTHGVPTLMLEMEAGAPSSAPQG